MPTTIYDGRVKITYWGGKGRQRDDDGSTSAGEAAKRVKLDHEQVEDAKGTDTASESDSETRSNEPEARRKPPMITFTERVPAGSRERLRHEPPPFGYVEYEAYDELQKLFKGVCKGNTSPSMVSLELWNIWRET